MFWVLYENEFWHFLDVGVLTLLVVVVTARLGSVDVALQVDVEFGIKNAN